MLEYLRGVEGKDFFYTKFLCLLFFEGFAKRYEVRSLEAKHLLGDKIHYLNGGLFLKHKIELSHPNIKINDAAFETLFSFFDEWSWYLDDRHFDDENQLSADEEINPDVLGYIFERYVNQRQMGAYYTKEDITGYISKNTIIPFIFDKVKKEHPGAFKGNKSGWCLLKQNPDAYFYDAMKKGIKDAKGRPQPLPADIAPGIEEVSKRADWNKLALNEYALETETWREVVARRARYEEVRAKMDKGEIVSINDMITYNLNVNKFARDFIKSINEPAVLRSFYHTIENITVLDLTCGSGAFLFAALNILGPLYEECLNRMESLIQTCPDKCKDFLEIQGIVRNHPNRQYFILKTVILNNLYGVDKMEEAVEICKLRMFLKLVANMDNVDEIKPLPDIDYNIRHGNTLVGYISRDEVDNAINTVKVGEGRNDRMKLKKVLTKLNQYQAVFLAEDEIDTIEEIERESIAVEQAFHEFRKAQTGSDTEPMEIAAAKEVLGRRLAGLRERLDKYLASEYGVKIEEVDAFEHWRETHIPFHWFTEFYGIIKNGGFDVIIGNPPYVEYRKVQKDYHVKGYVTESCNDLYAYVIERSLKLISSFGRCGFIIPISFISTDGFAPLRGLVKDSSGNNWLSTFAMRPSKLFDGADKHLCIWISDKQSIHNKACVYYSTKYHRWINEERAALFSLIEYVQIPDDIIYLGSIPKVGTRIGVGILRKLIAQNMSLGSQTERNGKYVLYHTRKLRYFVQFMDCAPKMVDGQGNTPWVFG